MIYPTKRFLWLLAIPLALAAVLPAADYLLSGKLLGESGLAAWSILWIVDGALAAALAIDCLSIPRRSRFAAERQCDSIFSVNYAHRVRLHLFLLPGWRRRVRALVYDDQREHMRVRGRRPRMLLSTGRNTVEYRLQIPLRGRYQLECVYLTCYSIFGLARRVYRIACPSTLRVYPDLKAVSRYSLLARRSHLGLLGIRRARRAGGDTEFERLREFQRDDEFRHIDWKATARQNKMIVRTYQMTQNQSVHFLLDCGRVMTAEFDGRSLLDYALNSALLLAHVALKQGDRVGLSAFAAATLRYVKAAPGPVQQRRLIQASYDLAARPEESNLDAAFQFLNAVSRKRSLVILITNVIDELTANQLLAYLGAISGRHLPFAVLLKQREIESLADAPPAESGDLFEMSAAADFLLWRESAVQRLRNRGVLCLEAFPDQLDSALINEYLKIKARKLL
ncbi:MAG: DUF58 domain-containing protein [Leptospirales bacterium]|nr:DUF58 domain-containing protein [Leptospirales bacterium]